MIGIVHHAENRDKKITSTSMINQSSIHRVLHIKLVQFQHHIEKVHLLYSAMNLNIKNYYTKKTIKKKTSHSPFICFVFANSLGLAWEANELALGAVAFGPLVTQASRNTGRVQRVTSG